jgi:hypothetical protein
MRAHGLRAIGRLHGALAHILAEGAIGLAVALESLVEPAVVAQKIGG